MNNYPLEIFLPKKRLKHKAFSLFFAGFLTIFPTYLSNSHKLDTKTAIHHEVFKYHHPKLLLAMIKVESNFNPNACSKKNALGLMQIRPQVWKEKLIEEGIIETENDLLDIEKNIKAGSYILTHYQSKSKTLKQALGKYNGDKSNKYWKKVMKEMK